MQNEPHVGDIDVPKNEPQKGTMKIQNYDTSLEELKDCPICGSRPIAFLQGNEYLNKRGKKVSITVKCPKCRIQRTDAVIKNSIEWLEETAIKNWNERIDHE